MKRKTFIRSVLAIVGAWFVGAKKAEATWATIYCDTVWKGKDREEDEQLRHCAYVGLWQQALKDHPGIFLEANSTIVPTPDGHGWYVGMTVKSCWKAHIHTVTRNFEHRGIGNHCGCA